METHFGDWFDLPHWAIHNFTWWVLTDTHGRAAELLHLLSLAPPDARIIHLGDIGDRGPSSLECFQVLDQTDAMLITGNHDLFIRPALADPSHKTTQIMRNLWVINGGVAFLKEIKAMPDYVCGQMPALIERVLVRQSNYLLDGNLLFLHGGVDPEKKLKPFLLQPPPTVEAYKYDVPYPSHPAWARSEFLRMDEEWAEKECKLFFIHGHTRLSDHSVYPRRSRWRLGVDWLDGMSALEIREGKARFVDVPARLGK